MHPLPSPTRPLARLRGGLARALTVLTVAALAMALPASSALAEDIDLSSWSPLTLDLPGGQAAGDWVLSDANTTVTQTQNADPSFYLNNQDDSDYTMNGTWQVTTSGDDDLMGFAFGYQDAGNCYIMDWKQNAQSAGSYGFRDEGFVIRKMHGDPAAMEIADYWAHEEDQERYTILATNLGPGTGWDENTEYQFTLDFSPGEFTVTVREGETVLWNVTVSDGEYLSGQFAFYNYSQEDVQYSGFTQNLAPECDAGGPYELPADQELTLDGSTSFDPDGEVVAWDWDLGDGNTATGATVTHTYAEPGTYTVTLCVTDDGGQTACCETTVEITDPVPVAQTSWTEIRELYR